MVNLVDFIIDKIKDIIHNDSELNEMEIEVRQFYDISSQEYPMVIVQEIKNIPNINGYSFTGEKLTDLGWQIEFLSQDTEVGDNLLSAQECCEFISNKICDAIETELKLKRETYTPSMPLNSSRTIFTRYARYNSTYNVLTNILK